MEFIEYFLYIMSILTFIGLITIIILKSTNFYGKGNGFKCNHVTYQCEEGQLGTEGVLKNKSECQQNCKQSVYPSSNVQSSIESMFINIPYCKNPIQAASQYYSNIQSLGDDVVSNITNNYTLNKDDSYAQAKIAADAINTHCQPSTLVNDKYPFCCISTSKPSKTNIVTSSGSCRPCISSKNVVCDNFNEDNCNNADTKFGINFCGWKNGRCVANSSTDGTMKDSVNCDKNNNFC
jgi:hypothetical protein